MAYFCCLRHASSRSGKAIERFVSALRALSVCGPSQPNRAAPHALARSGEALTALVTVASCAHAMGDLDRALVQYSNPQFLHEDLLQNLHAGTRTEYQMAWADRAQKWMFGDGVLTPAKARERIEARDFPNREPWKETVVRKKSEVVDELRSIRRPVLQTHLRRQWRGQCRFRIGAVRKLPVD